MSEEVLISCDCGRRYMRVTQEREEVEEGFRLCRCDRTLGAWSGPLRYVFEPESGGEDD